jgi:hypothetical protein
MPLNSNHLLEDDLEYELSIRHVAYDEKEDLSNKRRLLRNCLRNELVQIKMIESTKKVENPNTKNSTNNLKKPR